MYCDGPDCVTFSQGLHNIAPLLMVIGLVVLAIGLYRLLLSYYEAPGPAGVLVILVGAGLFYGSAVYMGGMVWKVSWVATLAVVCVVTALMVVSRLRYHYGQRQYARVRAGGRYD